jgi:hypothetical protein
VLYQISPRSKSIAKALGVQIEPSRVGFKKIAVYRNGKKIADVGDIRYNDYHSYRKINKKLAEERKEAYRKRHNKDISSGAGRLAWLLLWN